MATCKYHMITKIAKIAEIIFLLFLDLEFLFLISALDIDREI